MAAELERELLAQVPVDDDTEVHLSGIEVEGQRFLELRYYIPQTDHYGRGLIVPFTVARELARGINIALRAAP